MSPTKLTVSKIENINSLIMTSAPEFVQYAVIAALQCKDYVNDKVRMIKRRRDVAASALRKYLDAEFYLPDGALYVFRNSTTLTIPESTNSLTASNLH